MNAQTKFYLDQLRPLVGGKIIRLAICDDDEEEEYFGLVISMPNGKTKTLIFLRDDEGNGPGSFEIQDDEAEE
jgi:hypothetical protein